MIILKSFDQKVEEFFTKKNFHILTLDIETRDSGTKNIWNAEIISFSFCFAHITGGDELNPNFHFYGAIIENLDEEDELLKILITLLSLCQKIELTGHNIAIKHHLNGKWKSGYDLRKIAERSRKHNLKTEFLTSIRTFDTLSVAYHHYDHSISPRFTNNGFCKKILKSVEIEEDFQIKRPAKIQKLGPIVRKIFDNKQQKDRFILILRYNIIDTIVESIITLIFKQQLRKYKKISKKLPHTAFKGQLNIEELEIYSILMDKKLNS